MSPLEIEQVKKEVLSVALSYVGQKEKPGNSGFQDAILERKMLKIGWQPTWAWCACLVELILDEALLKFPHLTEAHTRYRTLLNQSATGSWNNCRDKGLTTKIPQVGYIVAWRNGKSWTGHIGIVASVDLEKGTFTAIEGNTDSAGGREGIEVAIKKRVINYTIKPFGLNLLGFIKIA